MKNWEKTKVSKDQSILEVLRVIQEYSTQFAMVVDEENRLLGSITDGDVRRGLLRGEKLEAPAVNIMRRNPLTIGPDMPKRFALQLMQVNKISKVPVVDDDRRVVGIVDLEEFEEVKAHSNPVVILAGGLGSRLGEETSKCPKVLLKMEDKPILQVIVEMLKKHGFYNLYISVNYKSEMIKEYFKNGEEFGVKIQYLDESKKLGTAGPLSLLGEIEEQPILVMNGDLLTKIDFDKFLSFHEEEGYDVTMCVREYEVKVPYGVIETTGRFVSKIKEKPTHTFFVNAGIYFINSHLISEIPQDEYHDMTDFLQNLVESRKALGVFPIHEYWIDIGRKGDLEKAKQDFLKEFK